MRNFPFEHNGETYWYSRSIGCGLFVFTMDDNCKFYILATKRGVGAANHNGEWSCPGGYLDFDETTKECAIRECFEETGIKIENNDEVKMFSMDDDPKQEKQNVNFRFTTLISDGLNLKFDLSNNEKDEVEEVKWIPVDELNKYNWAFNHNKIIKELVRLRHVIFNPFRSIF